MLESRRTFQMNPIASNLNAVIEKQNPHVMEMLSAIGRDLFFPRGILSQSAEAREKAHRMNATIGIATQNRDIMCFDSVMNSINDIPARESLTYAPSFGIPALREAWRRAIYQKNPSLSNRSVSLPVVSCGVTHGISTFADLWIDPGDAVILPDMMWGNYNMILALRKRARLQHYPLFDADFHYNVDGLAQAVDRAAQTADKVVVLLNFPHNPTGYSITGSEGERIAAMLLKTARKGTNVIVAMDDAYFGLFYTDDALKESLFAKVCCREPRLLAVKLDGATKENFVWGLRLGFITYGVAADDPAAVYSALEKKTAGCIRGNISNASHLSQSILLKSLRHPDYAREKEAHFHTLKQRAQRVKAVASDPAYAQAWEIYPFNAGYFMCIRLKTVNAERLRRHLLNQYGVGLISIDDHHLRIAFSCLDEPEIPALFEIVFKGVNDLT